LTSTGQDAAGGGHALARGSDARIWSRSLDAVGDPWLFADAGQA
jgi:hypothetical protein